MSAGDMRGVPPWRQVLNALTTRWKSNPAVEAVLLFGSRHHGTATASSDIDLYVLVSKSDALDEPGLQYVDGILIETFVNTRAFFEGHYERFHKDGSRAGQNQLAMAEIV